MVVSGILAKYHNTQRMMCVFYSLVLLLCTVPFLALSGCGSNETSTSIVASPSRNPDDTHGSNIATVYEDRNNTLTYKHDFGILKPKQQVKHQFVIKNDTAHKWIIRKIINTCSCTATDLSAQVIVPGQEETVTVSYRAGGATTNDKKGIMVLFEEPKSLQILLTVTAEVRELMTCLPKELELLDLGKDVSSQTDFEVQNFSDHDWQSISVTPSVKWLSASPIHVDIDARERELPRQEWRVSVNVDTSAMSVGDHHAKIEVTAKGDDEVNYTIPVYCRISSPLVAIPEQLFFGKVIVGKSSTCNITLRFAPDAIPPKQERVHFQHDLGEELELTWLKTDGQSWELGATFTPKGHNQIADKKVTISFSDPELPHLVLPIYAFLDDAESK